MGHEAVVATLRGHDCNPDEPQDHRQVGPLGAVQESLALLIRKCELIISFTCERQKVFVDVLTPFFVYVIL